MENGSRRDQGGREGAGAVQGDDIPDSCEPKCAKLLAALRGRTVVLRDTGSRENNALDKMLRCECKERKICGWGAMFRTRNACSVLLSRIPITALLSPIQARHCCLTRWIRPCSGTLSKYTACHSSVMSVGSFQGKSNCADELAALLECVYGQ